MSIDINPQQKTQKSEPSLLRKNQVAIRETFTDLFQEVQQKDYKNTEKIIKIDKQRYRIEQGKKKSSEKSKPQLEAELKEDPAKEQKNKKSDRNEKNTKKISERKLINNYSLLKIRFFLSPINPQFFTTDISSSIKNIFKEAIDKVIKHPESQKYLFSFKQKIPLKIEIERIQDDWKICIYAKADIKEDILKNIEDLFKLLRRDLKNDNIEISIEEFFEDRDDNFDQDQNNNNSENNEESHTFRIPDVGDEQK